MKPGLHLGGAFGRQLAVGEGVEIGLVPAFMSENPSANHLNDVGKDHPDLLVERVSGWDISAKPASPVGSCAMRAADPDQEGRSSRAGAHRHDRQGRGERRGLHRRTREDKAWRAHHHQGEADLDLEDPQRLVIDYARALSEEKRRLREEDARLKETELQPHAELRACHQPDGQGFHHAQAQCRLPRVELLVNGEVLAEEAASSRDSALSVFWRRPAERSDAAGQNYRQPCTARLFTTARYREFRLDVARF